MPELRDVDELYREAMEAAKKPQPQPVRKQKPEDDALNRVIRDFVTFGTPACGLLMAVLCVALVALLLTIGFWKTLLIYLAGFAGAVIGGVFDKSQWLKDLINALYPPRK